MARLGAVVDGADAAGFDGALRVLRGDLFTTNRWELLAPDFAIVSNLDAGTMQRTRAGTAAAAAVGEGAEADEEARFRGARVLAAGFWGNRWEFRRDRSYVHPSVGCDTYA